jgi:TonB family protein
MINSDGSVGSVSVGRSLNPALDQCALNAVRKWKFVPARLNGIAIATPIDIGVDFEP